METKLLISTYCRGIDESKHKKNHFSLSFWNSSDLFEDYRRKLIRTILLVHFHGQLFSLLCRPISLCVSHETREKEFFFFPFLKTDGDTLCVIQSHRCRKIHRIRNTEVVAVPPRMEFLPRRKQLVIAYFMVISVSIMKQVKKKSSPGRKRIRLLSVEGRSDCG